MRGRTDDKSPSVSVVIRTKNEERYIAKTLEAVFGQDTDAPFEVLVIDSGSSDNTLGLARCFPCRIFEIEPEKFTFGFALNFGTQQSRGDYVVNLSAHCVPEHTAWMRNLLRPLEESSKVAAAFGRQIPMKGVNPFEERELVSLFPAERSKASTTRFSNANCAVRKGLLEAHPFDELAPFSEDYIWSLQLPAEVEIKYVPEAGVYHSHPARLRYWTNRLYQAGLAEEYVRNVYGRAVSGKVVLPAPALQTAVNAARDHLEEFWYGLRFLWTHGYFSYLPLYPVYFALERYYYRKGLRDGRRRYRLVERRT